MELIWFLVEFVVVGLLLSWVFVFALMLLGGIQFYIEERRRQE